MELSIAVNTSFGCTSMRGYILYRTFPYTFCWEDVQNYCNYVFFELKCLMSFSFYHVFSHIIILQVDICSFGKTGTLASADMDSSRVGGLSDDIDLETNTKKNANLHIGNSSVLPCTDFCGPQVGDPLERVAIKGIEWTHKSDVKVMSKK
ncbi:hypothetical protein L1987_23690 [Smallanthus sonchifolius]|uniref:Uncharacterized protein n=1 Tax=Smallanthus sonchifolius TaxID=185202 RepID=A0ACB9IIY6_9ASTR|nr:hypothetical protein L1987_23690 [Smallanthus sonchifolius]